MPSVRTRQVSDGGTGMNSAPNEAAAAFGDLLRRHRIAVGCSQEQLAERAGMSAGGISALERGVRRRAYTETVEVLAHALQLSAGEHAAFHAAAKRARRLDGRSTADGDGRPAETNVPNAVNSFVGREADLGAVCRSVRSDTRMLTITGPGGVGKSRLALEAARALRPFFEDGAWLIELAQFDDPRSDDCLEL